jgi:hypothetical protein
MTTRTTSTAAGGSARICDQMSFCLVRAQCEPLCNCAHALSLGGQPLAWSPPCFFGSAWCASIPIQYADMLDRFIMPARVVREMLLMLTDKEMADSGEARGSSITSY